MAAKKKADDENDEALLQEMREKWQWATDEWRPIREEGAIDMRYVSGEPWEPKDKAARLAAGRPALALDELGQYLNQLINDIRQHKRAIQVTPTGNGANDKKAEFLASLIRQIEYRSNAQQAYTTTFENTVQRSYGFHRIKARYVSDRSFEQELIIEPIINPDMVTPDPDIQKPDGSDMKFLFNAESWAIKDYKRRWPSAKVQSYTAEWANTLPKTWNYSEQRIQIAEYWCVHTKTRDLLLLNNGQTVFKDELEKMPAGATVVNTREVETTEVKSYLTNGIEILERNDWPGTSIPFVCCFGKVLYVSDSAGSSKKKILSLVRLARDPFMLYCYYRTAEAEQVGMSTKFPYFVRRGSLKQDQSVKLQASLHEPVAFIEVEAEVEGAPPGFIPEMPQRNPFEPAIEALEVGAEGARRAIQAAMGGSPLPTSAQRRNEKSGVALKQIEDSSARGSYHFVDHYEDCITRTGELLKELAPHYYDTARDVTIRGGDNETETVRINDPQTAEKPEDAILLEPSEQYDVTLSTGPAMESEREVANEFADVLVQNLQTVAGVSGPQAAGKIMALAVKLKNLGPLGQEMADIISPPENEDGQPTPEQLQQQMAKMGQMIDMLAKELEAKTKVIETDQIKAESQTQLEALKQQGEDARTQVESQLKLVELQSKERIEMRKLEVQSQIEMAKLGNAQMMARNEAEQDLLHQHSEHDLKREEMAVEHAEKTIDRQAERDEAANDRAFTASESAQDREVAREQAADTTSAT